MDRYLLIAAGLAASALLVPATAMATDHDAAAAKPPTPPAAGRWVLTKAGSNAKGSFKVATGHHRITSFTAHGGDPECGHITVTLVSKPKLHVVNVVNATATKPEWVVGDKATGSTTGLNPARATFKVAKRHFRGSLQMQFAHPRSGASGYLVFDPGGAVCEMIFAAKK
jgi:hypothetical protein